MKTNATAPVFIGGTNGSGTRVYAQLLESAGVFQGAEKNYAFEPTNLIHYTKRQTPRLLRLTRSPTYNVSSLPETFRKTMEAWILQFGIQVQNERPEGYSRWGWKHPRNLFLVPLLDKVFSDCYFIQVIRDGRDMALADNKGDVRKFYRYLVSPDQTDPDPVACTSFWSTVNSDVADWSETHLGARFIWSRFEDLCADPRGELRRITEAIGVELHPSLSQECLDRVHTPPSLGRWRATAKDMQAKLRNAGAAGLTRFGYGA